MIRRLQALAVVTFVAIASSPSDAAKIISFKDDPNARTMPVYGKHQPSCCHPGPGRYERRKIKRYKLKEWVEKPEPVHQWGGDLVARARSYVGMTASQVGVRPTLWCSAFMRKLTNASGVDDRAVSWLRRPHVAPQVGAIVVVQSRRKHVGVVSGFTAKGDPIVISGNHNRRVAESVYPRSRVYAYVMP